MGEKISAVLIAKDEEELIGRAIRSVSQADEVIVLDTGSTDRTVSVARAEGARVLLVDPVVPFHFAQARNRAHDHASHDWVLAIDADEVLRPGSFWKIRKGMEAHPGINSIWMTFIDRAATIQKRKLYRKSVWTWKYRVHEQLVPNGKEEPGVLESAAIEHLPKTDKSLRHAQNVELLRLSIREDPEHLTAWKELGKELMLRKEWAEAFPNLVRYAEGTDDGPLEKSEALMRAGVCHANLGDLETAVTFFDRSAAADPRRREPLYQAGWWLMNRGPKLEHLDQAARYFEKALEIPIGMKPSSHLNQPSVWGGEPRKLLERCRNEISRVVEASRKTS